MKAANHKRSTLNQKMEMTDPKIESAVGEKIRALRFSKKLSLQDLGKKTDLTPSTISQIERGLSNPSLRALRRLAQALGVPVFFFFLDDQLDESEIIVRHNGRKILNNPSSNVTYELLSPNLNKAMEIIALTLEPGDASSDDYFTHKGEEACVVQAGKLSVILGETTHELEKGDCIQFNAEIPHRYINNDPKIEARLLFIVTPPSF